MLNKRPLGLYYYAVDGGDGRWLLMKDDKVQRSTPGAELSFAYDRESGTLHKHGEPEMVKRWLDETKAKLKATGDWTDQLVDDLSMLTVESYPLMAPPIHGVNYLSVDDANAIISTSGYIQRVLAKLQAIDVDVNVMDVSPLIPSA